MAVDIKRLVCRLFPTEGLGALQPFFTQCCVQGVVCQQTMQGDGKFFRVLWIHEERSVPDDFGKAANVANDSRRSAGHRFQRRKPKPFVVGWMNVTARRDIESVQVRVRDAAEHIHPSLKPQ